MTGLYSHDPLTLFQMDYIVDIVKSTYLKHYVTLLVEQFQTSCMVPLVVVNNNFAHDTVFWLYSNDSGVRLIYL